MSNAPSLFGDAQAPALPDNIRKRFEETTKRVAGSGGEYRRISIRGGKFRKIVGGEQQHVSHEPSMNIIIVDAAPVSRSYYKGGWDPDTPAAPTCWSADSEIPHVSVPEDERQAAKCIDCPQNIKGSGNNDSRACRFAQRLAVVIENDMDTVYQLQLPAASIFGKPENKLMPLQAYARVLKEHETPINVLVTSMTFDENSESPKLYFAPVRPCDGEEIAKVSELLDSQEVKNAIELTVTKNDGAEKMSGTEAATKEQSKAEPVKAEPAKPAEESAAVKAAKAKAAAAKAAAAAAEAEAAAALAEAEAAPASEEPVPEPTARGGEVEEGEAVETGQPDEMAALLSKWDDD